MLSTNTTLVAVTAIFACIIIAVILVFRSKSKIKIKGPLGMGLDINASNDSTVDKSLGIKIDGLQSEDGRINITDNTSKGIEGKNLKAKNDISISTNYSNNENIKFMEKPSGSISAEQLAAQRDNVIVMGNLIQPSHDAKVIKETKKAMLHNLPQPQYGIFIGREKEINQIANILRPYPQSNHALVTIDGVGGIGKSALALEIAHQYLRNTKNIQSEEMFDAIVWTSAKTETLLETIVPRYKIINTLEGIFKSIIEVLDNSLIPTNTPIDFSKVANLLTKNRTLLIIDNLESIEDEAVYAFLREFPAPTKIIVTTRRRIDVAYPIRLLGMPENEAKRLIEVECEKRAVKLTPQNITSLFERTGGIPLAIVWSIAQIGAGKSFENVIKGLSSSTSNLARFSFEKVMESIRNKPSHKLLLALSLFDDGASIEDIGYVADLPIIDREKGLEELEVLSLVNRKYDSSFFQMLPLTREYAQAELNQEERLQDSLLYRRERWQNKDSIFQNETAIMAWLAGRKLSIQNYKQQDEADVDFDRLSLFLGERYKNLSNVLSIIRKNLSDGRSFTLRLDSKNGQEISDITHFCLMLKNQDLLLSYKYFNNTKTVRAAPSKDAKAIEFFNGGWFVRFIQLKVLELLEKSNIVDRNFLSNLHIKLPDGNDFAFDLFFIVNNQPICIKTKTGQYDEQYIKRYAKIKKLLSIPEERTMLVILGASGNLTNSFSQRHKLIVANEENFIDKFKKSINAPDALSNEVTLVSTFSSYDNQINNPVPQTLHALLNRFQLRPFPEHRLNVINELVEVIKNLEHPKTMSEIKLILSEKLPISKSQLQDILNAIVRGGCLVNENNEVVIQFTVPIWKLISLEQDEIEKKCIERYTYSILSSNPSFFATPQNIIEFERVVGAKALNSDIIESMKQKLNLG